MNTHHAVPGTVVCVVHEPCGSATGRSRVFGLHGLPARGQAERLAARIVERHGTFSVMLDSHGSGRHTLTLVRHGPDGGTGRLPPELLADLMVLPADAETVPLGGAQRGLVREAVQSDGDRSRHVEQLTWRWTGPLDTARFVAAWQSVVERESVLRASVDWVAAPRLVLHERAAVDVVRHSRTALPWRDLLARDRSQGFELHRAGLLRLTLLDDAPAVGAGAGPSTRVLLTYHRALFDERAVSVLLREFYRAYLAGGPLPGGERRPDVRDHARWLAGQNTDAARAFWTRAAPPRDAALSPGRPGAPTGQSGPAQLQRRLGPARTRRLREWAAGWGAGESSALHLVWALLLYRATGARQPVRVAFGVYLSARDIALPGAAHAPGLPGGSLPLTVTVDPAAPVGPLVRRVRDAVLDMSAYPWVSDELIREWTGRGEDADTMHTTLFFDSLPTLSPAVRGELAAQGIRVGVPHLVGGDTSLAVTLVARRDADGGLCLTALYDRQVLRDTDAAQTLAQCVRLLGALADFTDPHATVGQVLGALDGTHVPRAAPRPPSTGVTGLTVLRRGEPGADVICLVAGAGVVPGAYERFAGRHDGPERIVQLRCCGVPPVLPATLPAALADALAGGGRLLLCGCGPGALTAYGIAHTLPAVMDPVVVMTGVGGAEESAQALSAGLRSVTARPGTTRTGTSRRGTTRAGTTKTGTTKTGP
ncbi:condensation domain-containing protein [Streptomyces sp. NPDC020490]|uniref:condensation domain-containing protein n=1 Tax=Streptomyces sp. NPDC020490 TaxID=3365078 RepID=UPI003797715E